MNSVNTQYQISVSVPKRVGRLSVPVLAGAAFIAGTSRVEANLVITPTFASSITSDPNAALIEAGINAAISRLDADIANPVTVAITFQEGGGLGSSSTYINSQTFGTYTNELLTKQTLTSNDNIAIASLPVSLLSVNGNASSTVTDSIPLFRALGVAANPPAGQPDSTITLNTSIMNLSRTGTQNTGFYDLQATAGHEMDEVLGAGGPGSSIGSTTTIGPEDLFRFSAVGVRSYTTSTTAKPYFSIDGGVTKFVYFNQAGGGSDYADWGDGVSPADGTGNSPGQLQDAFGTPGAIANIGPNELAALDVIGWNLTPAGQALEAQVASVPEPASISFLAIGTIGLLARRRQAI